MGMAQGGPVAIAYAARHPERVTRLLFYGSYAGAVAGVAPRRASRSRPFAQLIKVGWARPEHALPSGVHLDDDPRRDRGADALARRAPAGRGVGDDRLDVAAPAVARPTAPTLLPRLDVPTLVLHSRRRPDERLRARPAAWPRAIPGARLVPLDSDNHIVLGDEPAWQVFVDEVRAFLAPDGAAGAGRGDVLSRARARGAGAGRPRAATTTRSRPSWSSASAPSSDTCRTSTPSSACSGRRPARPRRPRCART